MRGSLLVGAGAEREWTAWCWTGVFQEGAEQWAEVWVPSLPSAIMCHNQSVFVQLQLTLDGPLARSSFPRVIGRTTPCFLLGRGRDTLLGGSPDGT